MASYLDQYGAGEEQRETLIKRLVWTTVLVLVVGMLGWYLFHSYGQVRQVKKFLALVRSKDYASAYRAWGCTPQNPCSGYSYEKFMEDWGSAGTPRIVDAESCNAGVIVSVDVNPQRREPLWAQKGSSSLSFFPYPNCPGKSPLSNMIHQTIGKLRTPFLN